MYVPSEQKENRLDNCGEILEAVGEDNLRAITQDFLELLDTASSTYEQTGGCALGVFS
jgi:hypothetical protein